ncbi:hypothetical protein LINPERPRIM_LOCUS2232 [Linum perenne]
MEECMNFCVQYLDGAESKFNRPLRKENDDDDDDPYKGSDIVLSETTRTQAHRWVLFHTEAVTPFIQYVQKLLFVLFIHMFPCM